MKIHIAAVHDRKRIKCSLCDATFSYNQGLQKHILSVCERKNPYECEFCGASFVAVGELNRQKRSIHEGKKPHNL